MEASGGLSGEPERILQRDAGHRCFLRLQSSPLNRTAAQNGQTQFSQGLCRHGCSDDDDNFPRTRCSRGRQDPQNQLVRQLSLLDQ